MGYSLEIKNRIFEEFYNTSFKSRVCLCRKILDNYMLFKDKEDVERLIRIDAGRVLLYYGLKLYSDVFAIQEETTECDPPRSEYESRSTDNPAVPCFCPPHRCASGVPSAT